MEEKKNFLVNCSVCDARKVSEETLAAYEKIIINTDLMVTDARSKEVLNRLPMVCNCDQYVDTDTDTEIAIHNGRFEITGEAADARKVLLIVNGTLEIRPGSEKALESYVRILVNGTALYPESMSAYAGKITVNGKTECYPDGCVVLETQFTVDRYFPLRARTGGVYYAGEKVLATDPRLPLEKLAEKNVRFITRQLVVAEETLENALLLVDEKTKLQVIPAGYVYVGGETVLTEELLEKYGTRLYIDGNLQLVPESTKLLPRLEALEVTGEVCLTEKQLEAFRKTGAVYGQIVLVKGKTIKNKVSLTLDVKMLEDAPEGILVKNCAKLYLAPEITRETILSQVQIKNCANVICSPEQKSAVELVAQNVGSIGQEEEQRSGLFEQMMQSEKMVNVDEYVL